MSDRDSTPGFAIGLIAGVAIGLAIGFLFAPQSGKETRKLIKDRISDIRQTAREFTADREKVYKETWKGRKGQPKVSDTYFE